VRIERAASKEVFARWRAGRQAAVAALRSADRERHGGAHRISANDNLRSTRLNDGDGASSGGLVRRRGRGRRIASPPGPVDTERAEQTPRDPHRPTAPVIVRYRLERPGVRRSGASLCAAWESVATLAKASSGSPTPARTRHRAGDRRCGDVAIRVRERARRPLPIGGSCRAVPYHACGDAACIAKWRGRRAIAERRTRRASLRRTARVPPRRRSDRPCRPR
jgi:hypothetical protein